ncbi:Yip1 family protein [Streptacidiphilus monticola]|uniref:Yip1 family protein n=1 Tax=Streptacidiphilus monticola TaxID=2161674 RepID=A0ABW1G674_9ACTN
MHPAGSDAGSEQQRDDEPGWTRPDPIVQEHVTTYRAGQPHPEVGPERLAWRDLLVGIYRQPTRTFAQMRPHRLWAPALVVSAVYGLLAAFALPDARSAVLDSSFGVALTALLSSAVVFCGAGVVLGSVTFALSRQLGGDGAWAPTVGLSMLIGWLTDAPRLLFAVFLGTGNGLVQLLGWATWLLTAWLLSAMLRQLHDLPWGKAAAAASLQLIVLLVLIKLPTLG